LRLSTICTTDDPNKDIPSASGEGEGFEDAFRQADQALYLAKSRGRNCVVAANEDEMHKVTGASKGTWALVSGRFKLHK